MNRRPQRPDRIYPPGWDDLDADPPPQPVFSTFGCVLFALAWVAVLLALGVTAWLTLR